MRRQLHFIEYLFCHLCLVFCIGRVGFLLYNRSLDSFSLLEAANACKEGLLAHDLTVVAFLLAVPLCVALLSLRFPRINLRLVLSPYYVLLGVAVGTIVLADAVMYEFWQFKLSSVVLAYAAYPEGAGNSVSMGFIVSRVSVGVALMVLVIVPSILITPKRLAAYEGDRAPFYWMRNITIILSFLMLVGGLFTSIGDAYFSRKLLLNHAATNPVMAFASTFHPFASYPERYNYHDEATNAELFRDLYPQDTEDITDTLLTTQRPDVLIVLMESFGGKFVQELGGEPNVAPNLSRLIPEGIFWTQYYSNSFRTDRGTVSAYSGIVSYPDVALMKERDLHDALPSLARSLRGAGYETSYLYGGAMTNMGKRDYLTNMGFEQLLDDATFAPEELNSSWGANDSTSAMKVYSWFKNPSPDRVFFCYQTLSSHEPWEVPYQRLEDKVLNAFAYTDQCLGDLVDSLKTLPAWDNLLVVIIPDHGYLYHQSYEDPEFFHSPMLWVGGAVKCPRQMDVLMNQSDLAATLLSQMGIPHQEYQWSRNVLSRNYTYPFVYCNFPAGVMLRDATGTTVFDITANEPITEFPTPDALRTNRALSILQTSYDALTPSF